MLEKDSVFFQDPLEGLREILKHLALLIVEKDSRGHRYINQMRGAVSVPEPPFPYRSILGYLHLLWYRGLRHHIPRSDIAYRVDSLSVTSRYPLIEC